MPKFAPRHLRRKNLNVCKLDFDYTERKNFGFGLMSDIHIDSPGHDSARFTTDMDRLASENAGIFFNGDIIDAIMPTDRKRYSRSGDMQKQDAQTNEICDYAVSRLTPYADYILYMGMGNHEVTAVKYNNTDILAMIVRDLNKARSSKLAPIQRGGYVGFVYLRFHRNEESIKRYVIYRDHGKGGNSPVTKGTIGLNRLYGTYDCDLAWLGHSHTSIIDPSSQWQIGVTSNGKLYQRQKIGMITPGYQRNFSDQEYPDGLYYKVNFPEERFYVPTGIGHGRLDIELTSEDIKAKVSMV
jgi:hypothetical protein